MQPIASRALAIVLIMFMLSGWYGCLVLRAEIAEEAGHCTAQAGVLLCQEISSNFAQWQALVGSAVPRKALSFSGSLFLTAAIALLPFIAASLLLQALFVAYAPLAYLERRLLPRHILQEAFARGRIHPKTF